MREWNAMTDRMRASTDSLLAVLTMPVERLRADARRPGDHLDPAPV